MNFAGSKKRKFRQRSNPSPIVNGPESAITAIELEITRSKTNATFVSDRLGVVTKSIAESEEQLTSINSMIATSENKLLRLISTNLKHKENLLKLYNSLSMLTASQKSDSLKSMAGESAAAVVPVTSSNLSPVIENKTKDVLTSRISSQGAAPKHLSMDTIINKPVPAIIVKPLRVFPPDDILTIAKWRIYIKNSLVITNDYSMVLLSKYANSCQNSNTLRHGSGVNTPADIRDLFKANKNSVTSFNASHSSSQSTKSIRAKVNIHNASDTVCPYELQGSCSDVKCPYIHLASYRSAPPREQNTSVTATTVSTTSSPKISNLPAHGNNTLQGFVGTTASGPSKKTAETSTVVKGDVQKAFAASILTRINYFRTQLLDSEDTWKVALLSIFHQDIELVGKLSVRQIQSYKTANAMLETFLLYLVIDASSHIPTTEKLLISISETLLPQNRQNYYLWYIYMLLTTIVKLPGKRNNTLMDTLVIPALIKELNEASNGARAESKVSPFILYSFLQFANFDALVLVDLHVATLIRIERQCTELGNIESIINLLCKSLQIPDVFDSKIVSCIAASGNSEDDELKLPDLESLSNLPTMLQQTSLVLLILTGSFHGLRLYLRPNEWFFLPSSMSNAASSRKLIVSSSKLREIVCNLLAKLVEGWSKSDTIYSNALFSATSTSFTLAFERSYIVEHLYGRMDITNESITGLLTQNCPAISTSKPTIEMCAQITSKIIQLSRSNPGNPAVNNLPAIVSLNQIFNIIQGIDLVLEDTSKKDAYIESIKFEYDYYSRHSIDSKTTFLSLLDVLLNAVNIDFIKDKSKKIIVVLLDWIITGHDNNFFTVTTLTTVYEELAVTISKSKFPLAISTVSRIIKVVTVFTLEHISKTHSAEEQTLLSRDVLLSLLNLFKSISESRKKYHSVADNASPLVARDIMWYHQLFFDILSAALHQFKLVDLNQHFATICREYLLLLFCPNALIHWIQSNIVTYSSTSSSLASIGTLSKPLIIDSVPELNRHLLLFQLLPAELFSNHFLLQCDDEGFRIIHGLLKNISQSTGGSVFHDLSYCQPGRLSQYLPRHYTRAWLPWMISSYLNPQSPYHTTVTNSTPSEVVGVVSNPSQTISSFGGCYDWLQDNSLVLQLSSGNDDQIISVFSNYINLGHKSCSSHMQLPPLTLNLSGLFCDISSVEVDSTSCALPMIPSISAFTSLLAFRHSLVDLSLSHCNLTVLPQVVLFLTKLKRLDVSKNLLKALPEGISSCLKNLEVLSIAWNLFEEFPMEVKSLSSLKKLYAEGNLCAVPKS